MAIPVPASTRSAAGDGFHHEGQIIHPGKVFFRKSKPGVDRRKNTGNRRCCFRLYRGYGDSLTEAPGRSASRKFFSAGLLLPGCQQAV